MSSKLLSRRTVLQGLGTSIALPLLDGMIPLKSALAQAVVTTPRAIFIYQPNGGRPGTWNYTPSGVLGNLSSLSSDISIVTGLNNTASAPYNDGHSVRLSCFLSGGPLAAPNLATTVNVPKSIDQRIADARGVKVMNVVGPYEHGTDNMVNGAYFSHLSWMGPSPAPKINHPSALFDDLYASVSVDANAARAAEKMARRISILDFAKESTATLRTKLSASDKVRLDEYLASIRETEKVIDTTTPAAPVCTTAAPRPSSAIAYDDAYFLNFTNAMFSLIANAMICNKTSVASYLLNAEVSWMPGDHHTHSHQEDPDAIAKFLVGNRQYAALVATFLTKLKNATEGSSNVLNNSIVLYGCGIGDGRDHTATNLPIIIAGGGAGSITPGRTIAGNGPLNNLMLTIGKKMGLAINSFGTDGSSVIAL